MSEWLKEMRCKRIGSAYAGSNPASPIMCTRRVGLCSLVLMAASAKRINVTLDDGHAAKLSRLAERTHVQEGTLARSLLSTALDDADPDAARITEILDSTPDAWERTQEGLGQAARGEGTPLDQLT